MILFFFYNSDAFFCVLSITFYREHIIFIAVVIHRPLKLKKKNWSALEKIFVSKMVSKYIGS